MSFVKDKLPPLRVNVRRKQTIIDHLQLTKKKVGLQELDFG